MLVITRINILFQNMFDMSNLIWISNTGLKIKSWGSPVEQWLSFCTLLQRPEVHRFRSWAQTQPCSASHAVVASHIKQRKIGNRCQLRAQSSSHTHTHTHKIMSLLFILLCNLTYFTVLSKISRELDYTHSTQAILQLNISPLSSQISGSD